MPAGKPYAVKTTEAPHYRRFVLQQGGNPLAGPGGGGRLAARGHRGPLGVGDGKGVMFVSHTGEIFPAGFLPLRCGRFPADFGGRGLSEPSRLSSPAAIPTISRASAASASIAASAAAAVRGPTP